MYPFHLPDTSAAAEVTELIDRLGPHAASEAAARASRSRDLGNLVQFCRWRQIERTINFLSGDGDGHSLH